MAFKPNYNQQRAERNRAKQAKAETKARDKEEQAARRKAGLPDLEPGAADSDTPSDEPAPSAELSPGETPAQG